MDEKKLFENFKEKFEGHQPDFLLYEISNANENAHSNLLERILKYNNYQFLPSFLVEVLGFSKDTELKNPRVTTQEKAIGLRKKGFIDVYIENGGQKIIIENKIKGAGDTARQLARYIATANNVKAKAFNDYWYNSFVNEGVSCENISKEIYTYYLSRLGDKEPSPNSLPQKLKEALGDDNFKRLSYKDNILPWLKDTVLPKIPYEGNGLMICALLQYIAYLEYYTTTQDWQTAWMQDANILQNMTCNDLDKYNKLSAIVNKTISDKNDTGGIDECTAAYISTLEAVMEEIFAHDLEDEDDYKDWRIHYTPSFIVLYKQSWTELEERKYACPTIQISIHTPFHKMDNKDKVDISLFITHVSALCVGQKGEMSNGKFPDRLVKALIDTKKLSWENPEDWDDHNRHFRISHKEMQIAIKDKYDFKNKKDRVKFYLEIIDNLNKKIEIVDKVLSNLKAEKDNMPN